MRFQDIDLRPHWDTDKVCRNPHKGWYHHYFDNGIGRYGDRLGPGDYLEDFPAFNHIYLRLGWSYLEPEPGRFAWQVIDDVIEPWRARGATVAFRISCKETDPNQPYATPRWVRDLGAAGTDLPAGGRKTVWEPDYGDPVFLDRLQAFHAAFAERYDGKPWVEYIDIGSYGDWGEGHTAASSLHDWPADTLIRHIDLHTRLYRKSQLAISDDLVGSRKAADGSREQLLQYLANSGITLRDDGISVKWFADHYGFSTLRDPEMFAFFWPTKPVVLELEHYDATKTHATYNEGKPLEAAVEQMHATFVGYHGYAREWLAENVDLARRLGNRCGYWFFPQRVVVPASVVSGMGFPITISIANRGVAPAYHPYRVLLVLQPTAGGPRTVVWLPEADPRLWPPDSVTTVACLARPAAPLSPGTYDLRLAMVEGEDLAGRIVELGLKNELRDADGSYRLGQIDVRPQPY